MRKKKKRELKCRGILREREGSEIGIGSETKKADTFGRVII